MLKLSGEQGLELRDALLSAFPSKGDLAQLANFGLEENVAAISCADDLKQMIAGLITWAVSQGRVADLLQASSRLNPGNPELQAFLRKHGPISRIDNLPSLPPAKDADSSPPQLKELDSPLARHDDFFKKLFAYLRSHGYGASNFKGCVLAALESCLPVQHIFIAQRMDGQWRSIARDETTAQQASRLLDQNLPLQDLLLRAWEHGRTNTYFSRNVTACQLSMMDGLCLLIPSSTPQGVEVLVLYGVAPSANQDITIAVSLNALLDITANFSTVLPVEEMEIALYNAVKRQFGYVSDYMYNRQFALFQKRLREVTMVFEPIVSLHSPPRIHSWEALARDPQTRCAPRDLFMMIELWGQQFRTELDLYCLQLATQQYIAAMPKERLSHPAAMPDLSVNVNPDTLLRRAYRERIDDMSRGVHGFPVNKLILEISEKFPLPVLEPAREKEDPGKVFRRFLKEHFRRKGVRFAVDDFGVGHASSQRLLSLGADVVKIDRYALLDNYGDHLRYLIQQAADVVGHEHVIVEGYDDESKFTLKELRDLDVWFIQGYKLGRARTVIDELPALLHNHICSELGYPSEERSPLDTRTGAGIQVA